MLQRAPAPTRSYEAQMLAAADRLFAEFDVLPVMTVVRSINGARSQLRASGVVPSPVAIEAAARDRMRVLVSDRPKGAPDPRSACAGLPAAGPAEASAPAWRLLRRPAGGADA